MQIKLESLRKLKTLDQFSFEQKFKINGLDRGVLTQMQYLELIDLWQALQSGHTTPEEYFEKMVKWTWIPTKDAPEQVVL
jgi:hypothetical protein